MYPKRMYPDTLRSLAFGSVLSSYAAVGTALTSPARMIRLVSTMDQDALISWDGSTNHMILPANSFILLDVTANMVRDDGFFIAEGVLLYVKYLSIAPSEGSVYLEVYKGVGGEQRVGVNI